MIGIGLDCTACTVVATDDDGVPLRPALLWMDQRAFQEQNSSAGPVIRCCGSCQGECLRNGCCPRLSGSSGMSRESMLRLIGWSNARTG